MKNEKLMVNHLVDKGLRSFWSIFPRKCGRTAGDWSLGLNVVALVVSLNLPWPSKFTKNLIILRLDQLESCRSFDSFDLETSLKNFFSLLVPCYKVHLQLLPLRFCGSFVLFSVAKRESFEFLDWKNQTVIWWNQCFRKDLHFFVLFFVMVELWICTVKLARAKLPAKAAGKLIRR